MAPTLEEALTVFGRTRSSTVTEVLELLGEAALADFSAPVARKNIDFHRAWIAFAGDPRARSWGLKTLTAQLPKLFEGQEHSYGDKCVAIAERLSAYAHVPPDGRIARALVAMFELDAPDFSAAVLNSEALFGRLFERHADDATEAALRAVAPYLWEADSQDIGVGKVAFPRRVELTATEQAVYRSPQRGSSPSVEGLWNAVLASPDDDVPREVLVDALQEQGDPRGEFIALQLREHRGQASEAEIARAQALTKKHGKAWLGPLRPVVYRAQFRRGFLWRIELAGSWSAPASTWEALAKHPSLGTVEEVQCGQATVKRYGSFVGAGGLPNLRILRVDDPLLLSLAQTGAWSKLDGLAVADDAIAYATDHPNIRRLQVVSYNTATQAKKWSSALRERLTSLTCDDSITKAAGLWRLLPGLEQLTCDGFTLTRADPARVHVSRESVSGGGLGTSLKGLPRSVKVVEVEGSEAYCTRLAKDYPRLEFVARPVPSGLVTNPKG